MQAKVGQGGDVGGRRTQRSPAWEEGSLMDGTRAIKVTLTKRAGSQIIIWREGSVLEVIASPCSGEIL